MLCAWLPWLFVPGVTARSVQAAMHAAAHEAARAGEASIVQLQAQVSRVGLALKDCEDRKVCLCSEQPAMPGTGSAATHKVALGVVTPHFAASVLQQCMRLWCRRLRRQRRARPHGTTRRQLRSCTRASRCWRWTRARRPRARHRPCLRLLRRACLRLRAGQHCCEWTIRMHQSLQLG